MKHSLEDNSNEDTDKRKKIKKSHHSKDNDKPMKSKVTVNNFEEALVEAVGNSDEENSEGTFKSNGSSLVNKNKNFRFKSKLGEKKGVKGTFSPQKKVLTEADKKELRKKQKLLKKQRRQKERGYGVPDVAKKIFEEMRCNKCPAEKRLELSNDLFMLLTGKISSAVRSHDLARMIQWLIKVGTPEVKEKVVNEVIEDTVNLCKTKYSNHIVQRILHDCDKSTRKKISSYFIGNIVKLIGNRFAAPVVEEYYTKFAKSKEKAYMRQELYSDLFRGAKNPSLTSLSEVLSQNPTLTSAILKSTKTILSKLVDKKSSLATNLVADVLFDYLQQCEEQDKLDLLEILKTNINILLKSKSGNMILMFLLWESTAKVKKSIVKELKNQVIQIAKSDGNVFVRSLFDSVDDTVLIKKAILPAILDNAEELVKDANGRKVILYLVAHRDTAYFHPKELDALKKADESKNVKKDITLKEKELLAPCVEALLLKVKENPEFWFSEPCIAVVTLAILKKGLGDALVETYQSVAEFIVKNISEDKLEVIENAGIHMVLKKLIKNTSEPHNEHSFSEYLINSFNVETVEKLININRGCFILVFLIETNSEVVLAKIKKLFKKAKVHKKLETLDFKGAEVLKKLISDKMM